MLLKKSFSIVDQNFPRPLMRFSDKYERDLVPSEKTHRRLRQRPGCHINGRGNLAALPFEKIATGHFRTFSTASVTTGRTRREHNESAYHPKADVAADMRRLPLGANSGCEQVQQSNLSTR